MLLTWAEAGESGPGARYRFGAPGDPDASTSSTRCFSRCPRLDSTRSRMLWRCAKVWVSTRASSWTSIDPPRRTPSWKSCSRFRSMGFRRTLHAAERARCQAHFRCDRGVSARGRAVALLLVIALLVKLTSSGPMIFRQERAGFHGRRFWMYKFRTMIDGAEQSPCATRAPQRDEWAGLQGDPRPAAHARGAGAPEALPGRAAAAPQRAEGRHELGRTSPVAGVRGEPDQGGAATALGHAAGHHGALAGQRAARVDFDGWMQMDLFYVDRWSLGLDLRILLRTIPVVLRGAGAS